MQSLRFGADLVPITTLRGSKNTQEYTIETAMNQENIDSKDYVVRQVPVRREEQVDSDPQMSAEEKERCRLDETFMKHWTAFFNRFMEDFENRRNGRARSRDC